MTYEEYVEESNSIPWAGLTVDGIKVQLLTKEEFENAYTTVNRLRLDAGLEAVKTQETQ